MWTCQALSANVPIPFDELDAIVPRKLQKTKTPEEQAEAALADIARRLEDAKNRKNLIDHLRNLPEGIDPIFCLQSTLRIAIVLAEPIDFDAVLKQCKHR
ncbi:hypothetical protein EG329_005920 [Mollisiaceae sp. DMI_Dod_QoI]|nr:hypothetical protein EG329_005920 [Helotiales sp. DMI_Dod_QoI]